MEPRARAGRHKSSLNFGEDLRQFLVAYGAPTHPDLLSTSAHPDSDRYLNTINSSTLNTTHRPTPYQDPHRFPNPYPETLRVLDEILTDFIIETCHGAVKRAEVMNRQKINAQDFEWVIRHDKFKMGRVQDLLRRNKALKEDRKLVDGNEESGGKGGKMGEGLMLGLAEIVGEDSGTGKGKGRGKGKRRKRAEMEGLGNAASPNAGKKQAARASALVGEDDLDGDADADGEGEDDEDDTRPTKRARSDTG